MSEEGNAFLVGLGVGAFIAAILGFGLTNALWEADLIRRDLALYCPVDGKFAFKGECGEH